MFKSVAIAGATGNIGQECVREFLAEKWTVRALCSKQSSEKKEVVEKLKGATVVVVDYSNPKTLRDAVSGVDVVISTLSLTGVDDNQTALLQASTAAGVKRFVPSDFGPDYDQLGADPKDLCYHPYFGQKIKAAQQVYASGLEWTRVHTGPFVEWFFGSSFGFDFMNAKCIVPGDGKTQVSVSYVATIARLLPHILNHPKSKNAIVEIADGNISWDEAITYFEKISGQKIERVSMSQSEIEKKIANDDNSVPFATYGDKHTLSYLRRGGTWKKPFNVEYLPKITVTPVLAYIDKLVAAIKDKKDVNQPWFKLLL